MYLKIYLLICLAAFLEKGGTTRNNDYSGLLKRIIGGEESEENEWPWLVNILVLDKNTNTYKHKCGGSLIDAEWVLTASHCLVFSFDAKYKIRLGEHDQKDSSGKETDHDIQYFHSHPRFLAEMQFAYDIALVKIKPAAIFSKHVKTIDLPALFYQVPEGSHCLVAGWGQNESGEKSSVVRHVEIPIVPYQTCAAVNNQFSYSNVSLFSNICGGDVNTHHSACNGDSGGPLVCKNSAGKYALQGIVSWGDEYCKSQFFGVFTRVSSFIDWIEYTKTKPPPKIDRACSKDYHYYCDEWNKMNYCMMKYISWNCPKTCGACDFQV